jgi:zeta-carotene desaturase
MQPARTSHRFDEHIDVVVVGGGIAGLSCGVALEHSGLSVAIFERDQQLGGRAVSSVDTTTGDAIDIGPHILLSEYRNMLDMMESFGTDQDVCWQNDRFITLLDDRKRLPMRLHSLPAPLHLLPSLWSVDALSARDKLSNARVTWLAMRARPKDMEELDGLTGEDFLRRCGVSERFRAWFWETASLALLNLPLKECSAAALLRMFGQLIGTSGYRSGFPRTALADLFAPAARTRIEAAGGRVECGREVVQLIIDERRVAGVILADGRRISTGACVTAIPPQALQKLLSRSSLADLTCARDLQLFEPCPYISTYLWFDRKITRERFWNRVHSPDDLNSDFYDLSNIRRDIDPSRSLIASNCIYSREQEHLSDGEIIARTRQELEEFAPLAGQARIRHAVVHRIPMAIVCPRPGTERARPHMATDIEGLLLAGDWTATGLPSCMESATYAGRLAAQKILTGRESTASRPIPPPAYDGVARVVQQLWPLQKFPDVVEPLSKTRARVGTPDTSRSSS